MLFSCMRLVWPHVTNWSVNRTQECSLRLRVYMQCVRSCSGSSCSPLNNRGDTCSSSPVAPPSLSLHCPLRLSSHLISFSLSPSLLRSRSVCACVCVCVCVCVCLNPTLVCIRRACSSPWFGVVGGHATSNQGVNWA